MVTIGKPHKGDKGTEFQLEVIDTSLDGNNQPADLTNITTVEMIFTDPDEIEQTKTSTVVGDPTEGIISFINGDDQFLNLSGFWYHRAKITYSNGNIFQSNDAEFEVLGKQT